MKLEGSLLALSATDLANHLACRHLTALDVAVARGQREPPSWKRPGLEALQERGREHERAYLDRLRSGGLSVHVLPEAGDHQVALRHTLEAMRSGAEVIAQATLGSGRWVGRADVLRRVERPSALGAWSYEAYDTKLARETRGGTILQMCLYSDLLGELQGGRPEWMHVVPPRPGFDPESYRVDEFLAYYRLVRRRLESAVDREEEGGATYPEPVPHCDVCRWWPRCDQRRRHDDHLCLVAGISKLQTRELQARRIDTLEGLAAIAVPLGWAPRRGAKAGYHRVREQARVQLWGRKEGRPVRELLPREPGRGLQRLPAPSPGDLFLDLEGDPYVGEGGLEYLFGLAVLDDRGEPSYEREWALDRAQERSAFERVVDRILERWARYPDLHVYHYSAYDPAALKRLMGRHATRESEVDRMLRAGRFVDLHAVVRQSLRASVERYSIKDLEIFYGFEREHPLEDVARRIQATQHALELEEPGAITEEIRDVVEGYNRDDCLSALRLRDWLEDLRHELEAKGETIPRPAPQEGEPSEALSEKERRARELREALTADVPGERAERSEEQQARWLLGHVLEWHRREDKAPWWEYYRLRELSDEELIEERQAISGLVFAERLEPRGRGTSVFERYRYPRQETSVREGDELHTRDVRDFGKVVGIDLVARTVDVQKSRKHADLRPAAVFAHTHVPAGELPSSLFRLGAWTAEHGVDAPGPYRAARDLLRNHPPRLSPESGGSPARNREAPPLERVGEDVVAAARRLALALDHGLLVIQGPPGSGKTHTSARMICELVRAGRKVGVSALSHKVIRNLLERVVEAAREERLSIRCLQKVKEPIGELPGLGETASNQDVVTALERGEVEVVGGTAWLWAREELFEAVDVLFVDEAGQMPLANALAAAQGARSLVLVGDPQQLEQPIQGSHPEGTGVSALQHVLRGRATLEAGRGLFLSETWRLHPALCRFTSDVFYEGRLRPRPGLEGQVLEGPTAFAGAGLWFVPVRHEGNQSSSPEEVEAIATLVGILTREGAAWRDASGRSRPLGLDDLLIVAPYNAQVADLGERLPGARVGTVDKFQGQEAPVVICSLTTSAPEDAPRGMEFLYSLNRLNVATSRARASCILVGSPRLFEPECQSPRQMQLANGFCRYLEMARVVALEAGGGAKARGSGEAWRPEPRDVASR